MIYITGDMHGEYDRFLQDEAIKSLTIGDHLIVTGDFGFVNSNENTITRVVENNILDKLEQMPFTILFVDGVNENFRSLNIYPVELWHGGNVHRIRKNIFHLMRGQVFIIDGKKIFAMGGALSDRIYDLNKSENEQYEDIDSLPTKKELDEGWENLRMNDYSVDIILTHTPTAAAITSQWHMIKNPNGGAILPFLDKLIDHVTYKAWYFGLLHMDIYKGNEQSPLGKYCAEKKMHPVWFKVIPIKD